MSDTVIRIENLSKKYLLDHQQEGRSNYKSIREIWTNGMSSLGKKILNPRSSKGFNPSQEEFWALKDVSFEIKQGDRVGIIGRNGAGKSTLLKVLSRITEPTSGRIGIKGRIASLLEVGTGFHPELTGRENIFLNGAILGMGRAEIARKFEEIVDFAEVEKFLDTPVKRYSSGMYVRLAFAVAAHLEPEILIVDEVLAVGDATFQKKCLGKMEDVAENEGRTILFVSHNMTALKSLCTRAVWMQNGTLIQSGSAGDIVSRYLTESSLLLNEQIWDDMLTAPGNDKVRLHRVSIAPEQGNCSDGITVSTPLKVEFEYWNLNPGELLNLSIALYNLEDVCIFNTVSAAEKSPAGLLRSAFYIPQDFLNDDTYRVRLMIVKDTSIVIFERDSVIVFEVSDVERESSWYGKWEGAVRPKFKWESQIVSELLSVV
jgi:lipopolysaccharide transport system ATP-binding protein